MKTFYLVSLYLDGPLSPQKSITKPNAKHCLDGYKKALQCWTLEQCNCILWSDGAPSSTLDNQVPIPDLTNALVAECNQILKEMFQHLG